MKHQLFKTTAVPAFFFAAMAFSGSSFAAVSGALTGTSTQNIDIHHVNCPSGQTLKAWFTVASTDGTSLSYASIYSLPYARCIKAGATCTTQAAATAVAGKTVNAGLGIPNNTFAITLAQTTAAAHSYTVNWACNNGAAQAGAGTAIINQ